MNLNPALHQTFVVPPPQIISPFTHTYKMQTPCIHNADKMQTQRAHIQKHTHLPTHSHTLTHTHPATLSRTPTRADKMCHTTCFTRTGMQTSCRHKRLGGGQAFVPLIHLIPGLYVASCQPTKVFQAPPHTPGADSSLKVAWL